jgi:hypothetical protein
VEGAGCGGADKAFVGVEIEDGGIYTVASGQSDAFIKKNGRLAFFSGSALTLLSLLVDSPLAP